MKPCGAACAQVAQLITDTLTITTDGLRQNSLMSSHAVETGHPVNVSDKARDIFHTPKLNML